MIEKPTKSDIGILIAAAAMALGAFCPIVSLPIVGSINYVKGGHGDGIFVLACSAAVVACVTFGYRRTTGLLASAALLMMITALVQFAATMGQARHAKDKGAFSGLGQLLVNSVGLEWGWVFLIVGAMAIIMFAFLSPFDRAIAVKANPPSSAPDETDSFSSADKIIAEYLENRKISPAIRNQLNSPQTSFGKRR